MAPARIFGKFFPGRIADAAFDVHISTIGTREKRVSP
jgi:hypothetical protein